MLTGLTQMYKMFIVILRLFVNVLFVFYVRFVINSLSNYKIINSEITLYGDSQYVRLCYSISAEK